MVCRWPVCPRRRRRPRRRRAAGSGRRHRSAGSSMSFGAGEQVPSFAARLHCWQVPLQAVLQQTPSVQLPLAHSVNDVQVWPSSALHCWVASHARSLGQVSSGCPAGTLLQVPALPATLHDLHLPAHSAAVCAQQTPSTQFFDLHLSAVAVVQPAPLSRSVAFGMYSQNSDGTVGGVAGNAAAEQVGRTLERIERHQVLLARQRLHPDRRRLGPDPQVRIPLPGVVDLRVLARDVDVSAHHQHHPPDRVVRDGVVVAAVGDRRAGRRHRLGPGARGGVPLPDVGVVRAAVVAADLHDLAARRVERDVEVAARHARRRRRHRAIQPLVERRVVLPDLIAALIQAVDVDLVAHRVVEHPVAVARRRARAGEADLRPLTRRGRPGPQVVVDRGPVPAEHQQPVALAVVHHRRLVAHVGLGAAGGAVGQRRVDARPLIDVVLVPTVDRAPPAEHHQLAPHAVERDRRVLPLDGTVGGRGTVRPRPVRRVDVPQRAAVALATEEDEHLASGVVDDPREVVRRVGAGVGPDRVGRGGPGARVAGARRVHPGVAVGVRVKEDDLVGAGVVDEGRVAAAILRAGQGRRGDLRPRPGGAVPLPDLVDPCAAGRHAVTGVAAIEDGLPALGVVDHLRAVAGRRLRAGRRPVRPGGAVPFPGVLPAARRLVEAAEKDGHVALAVPDHRGAVARARLGGVLAQRPGLCAAVPLPLIGVVEACARLPAAEQDRLLAHRIVDQRSARARERTGRRGHAAARRALVPGALHGVVLPQVAVVRAARGLTATEHHDPFQIRIVGHRVVVARPGPAAVEAVPGRGARERRLKRHRRVGGIAATRARAAAAPDARERHPDDRKCDRGMPASPVRESGPRHQNPSPCSGEIRAQTWARDAKTVRRRQRTRQADIP